MLLVWHKFCYLILMFFVFVQSEIIQKLSDSCIQCCCEIFFFWLDRFRSACQKYHLSMVLLFDRKIMILRPSRWIVLIKACFLKMFIQNVRPYFFTVLTNDLCAFKRNSMLITACGLRLLARLAVHENFSSFYLQKAYIGLLYDLKLALFQLPVYIH